MKIWTLIVLLVLSSSAYAKKVTVETVAECATYDERSGFYIEIGIAPIPGGYRMIITKQYDPNDDLIRGSEKLVRDIPMTMVQMADYRREYSNADTGIKLVTYLNKKSQARKLVGDLSMPATEKDRWNLSNMHCSHSAITWIED